MSKVQRFGEGAKVSAKLVKELRDLTGAPLMDCKKALESTAGDIGQAK